MFKDLEKEILLIIFKNKVKLVLEKNAYNKKEIYDEINGLKNILNELNYLIKFI